MNEETPAPSPRQADVPNKRTSVRRRTIFGGVLFLDDGQHWDCSVSDISKSGVKVRTPRPVEKGTLVDLKINKFDELRQCEVIWVGESFIGLRFLVEIDDGDKTMASLFSLGR